jgi:uncharacterized membrane protein
MLMLSWALAMSPSAQAADGVVRAVLFSSPTCPHCQWVRERVLPSLGEHLGGRLQGTVLSTATPVGRDLYWTAVRQYGVEQRGVPLLLVGDFALVGSDQIPRWLPTLAASYLAEGGTDWPALPGLAAVLAVSNGQPEAVVATAPPPALPQPEPEGTSTIHPVAEARGPLDRLWADPHGNGLAVLVLVGMLAVVLRSVVVLRRPVPATQTHGLDWLTPMLALAGLGVAGYLAQVEVLEVEAVCGPVGDCNSVQQSEHARLFGVVPIGVVGVLGFLAILVAWGVRQHGSGPASAWAAVALLALSGLGTLFSIYLTFLEPFVIGATCRWCLSSAITMTTLFGLALTRGREAAAALRLRSTSGFNRPAS